MSFSSINKWANNHTYYPLDILRVALGIFLFIKGTSYVSETGRLMELAEPLESYMGVMFLVHYIAPAHLVGGVLITFGLLTRWASLAHIPILIGAVAINFMGEMIMANLILSSIALLLCIFFAIYGSGKHSADYFFKMRQ